MPRPTGPILLLIILCASIPRFLGIFDDFWLDEIWSYTVSRTIHHPLDVLLSPAARIDNNHPLNTLFLWMLGEQQHWWIYRIPALLAGIGSVILTTVIALRRGPIQAILATALVGFSYPLIFYSSEARGYGLVVFFALLAFDAVERYLARPAWGSAIGFILACVFGVLSHLTFIHFYLAALAWTSYRFMRAEPWPRAIAELARIHVLPIAFCATIYVTFVQKLVIGGWAPEPLPDALAKAISGLFGIDFSITGNLIVAGLVVLSLIGLLLALRQRGSDLWVFLLVALVISPALLLGRQYLVLPLEKQQPLVSRYFIVALPFFFIAISLVLPDLLRRPPFNFIAMLVLALLFAISLGQTFLFLRTGRGHYSDAVKYMAENTPASEPVVVISDHYYRTQMVLDFYRRVLPPGRAMQIIDGTGRLPVGFEHGRPQWAIRHYNRRHEPPAAAYSILDTPYLVDKEFDWYGLSGYCWYVYRRKGE